jgi:3-keto-5-aminohexanoate cleavage enzyme
VCLKTALESGGKIRVGFENSLWNSDGSLAQDNAERVTEMKLIIDQVSQLR